LEWRDSRPYRHGPFQPHRAGRARDHRVPWSLAAGILVAFVLKEGESLQQHVGILVHSADATTGRVAERYQQFIAGKLD